MSNIPDYVKTAYKALDDKMATDIRVLDISNVSSVADYFIIANGNNPNQVRAMADSVEEELFKIGVKIDHTEGMNTKKWILLDFGNIVVHIFDKEHRQFYDLERVWGDAPEIPQEQLQGL